MSPLSSVPSSQKRLSCLQTLEIALKKGWQDDFLVDATQNRTYKKSEFFQLVGICLQRLNRIGLQTGDSLLVVLENSTSMASLFFACLLGGITFIPLDPGKGAKDFEDILKLVNAKAHLTTRPELELPCPRLEATDILDSSELSAGKTDFTPAELISLLVEDNSDRIALITFTSGSTGQPKGVCHSLPNLVHAAEAFSDCFNFTDSHCFYHNFPMSYMAGLLNSLLVPFVSGSRIVIGERFGIANIHSFWKPIMAHQVNVLWFNPTMLSLLLKLDRSEDGIQYAAQNPLIGLAATAPLSETIKNRFEAKYAIPLYQSYGLSETLFVSTNRPNAIQEPDCVGYLLQGAEIKFAPQAETGLDPEILINVPWMFKGYLGSDTASYFKNGFYRSGDLGRQTDSGELFITGRCKDIVIRGGINISPRRLEEFIAAQEGIEECAIVGLVDEILGEKLVMAYVEKRGAESGTSEKQILAKVSEQFGPDYRIDRFMKLETLPVNSNGKLDRNALKTLCAAAQG